MSIGKDVRVAGEPPRPEGWFVDIDDPLQPGSLGRLRLRDGAIGTCTASTSTVVGAATAGTGIAATTVVAGEAWWAQAIAKAAFVAGPDAAIGVLAQHSVTGVIVLEDGEVLEAPGLNAFF